MTATLLTTPTATPNQSEASIVLTSGSTVRINASATRVFNTILDTDNWSKWNKWTPSLTFADESQSIRKAGSEGKLLTRMEAQNREYDIPVKILDVTDTNTSAPRDAFILQWRSLLMPSWFASAERVQTVSRVDAEPGTGDWCELRQWESMSGWGVYLLKWVFGIEKQLNELNVEYANALKAFVEDS